MKTIKILFVLIALANLSVLGQAYNNGATITMQNGCYVYAQGDYNNHSGTTNMVGDSRIYILNSGNFINIATFNQGSGYVLLDGSGNQHIQGNTTTFYNLYFRGSGTKYVDVNTNVSNYLNLEQPVSTGNKTIIFTSTSLADVYTNGSDGYIYSTSGGGLSRPTNSTSNYEFPVGTPGEGLRSVTVTPESATSQTYRVGAIDANAGGTYSFGSVIGSIGGFNTNYYHQVDQTSGSGVANVSFYYKSSPDAGGGTFQGVARWNGSAWEEVPSFAQAGSPYNWIIGTDISSFSPFVLFSSGSMLTVPTLSEWGLIILGLLTMTMVMLFIGKRELAFAGAKDVNIGFYSLIQSAPFSRKLYLKILSICLLVAIAGFVVVHVLIGTNGILDLMGTVACTFIIAYIVYLYIEFERFGGKAS